MEELDVCMPTWNSGDVLENSLKALKKAENNSSIIINKLIVCDNNSVDDTVEIASSHADKYDWKSEIVIQESTLGTAREELIRRVSCNWFLFLDDDVMLGNDYLHNMKKCCSDGIGAIQGRKFARTNKSEDQLDSPSHPTDWVQMRSFRGGTHATMIQTKAVDNLEIPDEFTVWEDEYIRRKIEESEFLWIFNHQAIFKHQDQGRNPAGWKDGYLQAKYNLRPSWNVALSVPFSILSGNKISGNLKLTLAYFGTKLVRRLKSQT